MKAPWFPFYTGDFLASPDVQLMEAHEVGAYVLLLANSWQSDTPGYLPDEESRLRRVCRLSAEQWKESRGLLLGKWPVAENGMRCNKRLLLEAGKQQARRDRLSANGAKGGRPAQNQKDSKQEPTDNLQLSKNNLQVMPEEATGLLSSSQPQTTKVVVEAAAPVEVLPAKPTPAERVAQQVASDGGATFTADNWPGLNDPDTFAAILKDLGYAGINAERYRLDIRATVRANDMDVPSGTLRKFIKSYLKRESDAGPLQPAPKVVHRPQAFPANPAELWGGVNPDYDHRTHSQPAGKYNGNVN